MKVQTTKNTEFKPVSMTITFETQKELDDFGSLCNLACISESLKVPSYLEFEKLGGDVRNVRAILNNIKKHPSFY